MSKKDKKQVEKEAKQHRSATDTETSNETTTVNSEESTATEKTDPSKETVADNETSTEGSKVSAEECEALKAKYAQLNDTYLRTLAEYDNYRKRSIREKAELIKNGGESVLVNILPVVDDFERGLSAMEKAEDMKAVIDGMNLIYSKLQGFLKQNGISVIETENKVFDTDLHEAITTLPAADESTKGKIIDCVQKGYYLHDKVIRYSKVVVAN